MFYVGAVCALASVAIAFIAAMRVSWQLMAVACVVAAISVQLGRAAQQRSK